MLNLRQIIHHFFKKEELEQVSEEELRKFVQLYPYSTAGHLLLAKKLKETGDKRAFEKEISSTALYFNNPVWLEWLIKEEESPNSLAYAEPRGYHGEALTNNRLDEERVQETGIAESADIEVPLTTDLPAESIDEVAFYKPIETSESDSSGESLQTHSSAIEESIASRITGNEEPVLHPEAGDTDNEQHDVFFQENIVEDELPQNFQPLIIPAEEENFTQIIEESSDVITDGPIQTVEEGYPAPSISRTSVDEIIDEAHKQEQIHPTREQAVSGQSFSEELQEQPAIETGTTAHIVSNELEDRQETDSETNREEVGSDLISSERDKEPISSDQQDIYSSNTQDETGSEGGNIVAGENELTPSSLEKENLLTGNPAETISFEPYHTIDYFASQGIKLKQDELSRDKLGQQLKSFTEWLRSMKKVPGQIEGAELDENAQVKIQQIAQHSVEEKEVLTEAMAEVWAKQGNRQKAILIYQKLSLQNPDKSAYFAAKIDQLNAL